MSERATTAAHLFFSPRYILTQLERRTAMRNLKKSPKRTEAPFPPPPSI